MASYQRVLIVAEHLGLRAAVVLAFRKRLLIGRLFRRRDAVGKAFVPQDQDQSGFTQAGVQSDA